MIDEVVDRFIQLRDLRAQKVAAHKADTEAIEAGMKRCEGFILQHLNTHGMESIGTKAGTAYKHVTTSATVADWESALDFIKANNLWNLLDRKVNKTAVVEYRTENDDIPPGVNWREEAVVRIRRS